MSITIRVVRIEDLETVLELNEAAVPAVNSINMQQMRWFVDFAAYFRVAVVDDGIAAFLIGLRPGVAYDSPNYQWFCRRHDDFGYVDRVAVATHARRLGLASKLYEDFRVSLPPQVALMTCEVNLRPPNETSMRFHEQLGFQQVGSQDTDGGSKRVALMERVL